VIETTSRLGARLLAGALAAAPVVAQATGAEEGAHGAAEGAGEAAHAAPSLFSVEPGLLIWTCITFVVVLVVLRLTAWKPLMQGLEEREKRITGAIEEADRIKSEAQQLLARYETMIDHAREEAHAILEESRRDGLAVQEEIRRKAHQEAVEFKERARREIELAKDSAIHELWEQAASLSTELATRILGRTLNDGDQERLVRELVREMRGNGSPAGTGKA